MTRTRLPGPSGRAQLGPLRRMFADPVPVLEELRDTYGPVSGLGFGPARMAIVGDAASLRELFALPTESFRWGHKFNVLGFVVGDGSMIVSDGPDHRRRRGSVQAAFSRRRLEGWIPMILDEADAAIDALDLTPGTPSELDLYPVGRSIVLHVAVRAFFGARLAARADEIGALFRRSQDYLEQPGWRQVPHPFPGTARARVRADRHALDAIIDEAIADARAQPSGDPLDVLEALVQDASLTDAEIRDQVVTLIGAGYDTTAASLAWILQRAGRQPEVWARLRAEADEVLGSLGTPLAADVTTLRRLGFADAVMRETLRLHPAGVLSPREAAVDVTVGGHTIAAGTLVLWSPYLAGRDGHAWPDALHFDPDRFLGGRGGDGEGEHDAAALTPDQQAVADGAWVPFGKGARMCIGFALAQMELTLITARLAQRLDITLVQPEVPRPKGMVVNRPEGGVPARVNRRV